MKNVLLWIASASAICLFAVMLYARIVGRRRQNSIKQNVQIGEVQRREQEENALTKEAPDQKEQTEEVRQLETACEKDPAEKQKRLEQLREQLCQQRAEICRMEYRQNCAALLEGLSGGIQELLALENRHCPQENSFCRRLTIAMGNESMRFRIDHRKAAAMPAQLSLEEEAADEETLCNVIRMESLLHPAPALDLPWDALVDQLLPCLSELMLSAEENRAADCRRLLAELRGILSAFGIEPVWYHDEVIQSHADMQLDYVINTRLYTSPALYYHTGERYVHIGAPGRTNEQGKLE